MAATSLFDAPVQYVLGGASGWTEGVLGGELVTALCVTAVAVFGMLLFTGRMNVRHGVSIVVGCFLLLSAGALAAQLQRFGSVFAGGGHAEISQPVIIEAPPLSQAQYDPYAGASLRRD